MTNRIPYVHALGPHRGLALPYPQSEPASEPYWFRIVDPFVHAFSSRIAHGQTPVTAAPSGAYVQTPIGSVSGGTWGGFDPRTLLLIGGAAVLFLAMAKK